MFRKWAFALPLAAVVAAAVVVPSVMSSAAAAAPMAACTSSTPSVTALSDALTKVQTALSPTPDPAKLAPVAGDLFNAITAAQKDGCLPALPSSTSTSPSAPPTPPPGAKPQAGTPANCQTDAVSLLSSALSLVSATLASPPNPTAVTSALSSLATAVTGVNADSCLPGPLPVPTLPPAP
jgi:hypothetical protein